jgi:hypothetical protein
VYGLYQCITGHAGHFKTLELIAHNYLLVARCPDTSDSTSIPVTYATRLSYNIIDITVEIDQ